MERLTKKNKCKLSHGEEIVICKCSENDCNDSCMRIIPCKWYKKAIEKLKRYEDLEEQGRLIKFPCRVGDMLYYPDKEFNIIIPVRLTEIVIKFNGLDTSSCQYDCSSFDECGDVYEEYEFDTNDFGKSVFLIKSEAEAKLKELRGGKNGSME